MYGVAVRKRLRRPSPRALATAAWLGLLALTLASAFQLRSVTADVRPGPNEFSIPAWEARYFLHKWLYGFGQLFRPKLSVEEENAKIARFIALDNEINTLERGPAGAASGGNAAGDLEAKRRERDGLSSDVAAIFEERITAIAKRAGLARKFGPISIVWPPVDLEFASPPRTLATSRRDKIALTSTTTLQPGLSLAQVDAIENETQATKNLSALAFRLDGLGAYPTINDYPTDYRDAFALATHEWTHNYLFFRPLGIRYYKSYDLRTINETVANTVGNEIANEVVAAWPLSPPTLTPAPPAGPRSDGGFDIGAALRELRGQVDDLLATGKVEEAEALMEQRRQEFAANGYYFRKLNQAYFAFTNLYAGATGNTGVTNPIGPKVDELRRRAGNLATFVKIVGDVKSAGDLDRALTRLP
jgi:hypothetical protein